MNFQFYNKAVSATFQYKNVTSAFLIYKRCLLCLLCILSKQKNFMRETRQVILLQYNVDLHKGAADMKDGYAAFLLSFCLHRFNGERSLAAVYHLFSGKNQRKRCRTVNGFSLRRFLAYGKILRSARSRQQHSRCSKTA